MKFTGEERVHVAILVRKMCRLANTSEYVQEVVEGDGWILELVKPETLTAMVDGSITPLPRHSVLRLNNMTVISEYKTQFVYPSNTFPLSADTLTQQEIARYIFNAYTNNMGLPLLFTLPRATQVWPKATRTPVCILPGHTLSLPESAFARLRLLGKTPRSPDPEKRRAYDMTVRSIVRSTAVTFPTLITEGDLEWP